MVTLGGGLSSLAGVCCCGFSTVYCAIPEPLNIEVSEDRALSESAGLDWYLPTSNFERLFLSSFSGLAWLDSLPFEFDRDRERLVLEG